MLTKNNNLPETADYKLSVQQAVHCEEFQKKRAVYAVINKVTNVVEAEVNFLCAGYEAIYDLQARLDICRKGIDPRCINNEENKIFN